MSSRSNPNIVFDLDKAANTLEAKVINNKGLSFAHEPYPVEGDGIDFLQTQVFIKSGGTLKGKPIGYVEFELMKGPL